MRKGTHLTEENKRKISLKLKGHHLSEQQRIKIKDTWKNKIDSGFKHFYRNPNERRTKVKQTWKKKMESGYVHPNRNHSHKWKEGQDIKFKETLSKKRVNGWTYPKEGREKQNKTLALKKANGWKRPRYKDAIEKQKQTMEIKYANGYVNPNKGKHLTKEMIDKQKATIAKKTPEEMREWRRKIIRGSNLKPNYCEQKLVNLFDTNNLPYEYVGDWSFWINGKNPDFINYEKKKVIELFGERYHSPEDEFTRTMTFAEEGYDTLVIWGRELKDLNKVLDKIKTFDNLISKQ